MAFLTVKLAGTELLEVGSWLLHDLMTSFVEASVIQQTPSELKHSKTLFVILRLLINPTTIITIIIIFIIVNFITNITIITHLLSATVLMTKH